MQQSIIQQMSNDRFVKASHINEASTSETAMKLTLNYSNAFNKKGAISLLNHFSQLQTPAGEASSRTLANLSPRNMKTEY